MGSASALDPLVYSRQGESSHMGRKRNQTGLMDAVATLPWPAGVVLGIVGFLVIRFVFPMFGSGPLVSMLSPTLTIFAFFWLAACLLAAFGSAVKEKARQRLLDTRTNLESLSATGWRNFEQLVGEAFRRQGYAVDENHQAGPDGGIDLVLHKNGRRTLVQCKQWRRQQVGVSVVREMYGLLVHHNADAVKIVSTGSYTAAAEAFIDGKPIQLISGEELLRMIQAVQASPPSAAEMPAKERIEPVVGAPPATNEAHCPRCNAALVERRNRRTGESFLGCSRFPACRGTQ